MKGKGKIWQRVEKDFKAFCRDRWDDEWWEDIYQQTALLFLEKFPPRHSNPLGWVKKTAQYVARDVVGYGANHWGRIVLGGDERDPNKPSEEIEDITLFPDPALNVEEFLLAAEERRQQRQEIKEFLRKNIRQLWLPF